MGPLPDPLPQASPPLTVSMAKASAFNLACSTEPSPSMRRASARDSASALAVPVLSTAVLEGRRGSGDARRKPSPALLHPHFWAAEVTLVSVPPPAAFQDRALFSSGSQPTSEPPAPRVRGEPFQLRIGPRSSASQAGRGLLAQVSEPRAWTGEGTGKMLAIFQDASQLSKGRDRQSAGGARGKHSTCQRKHGVRANSLARLQAQGKGRTCDPRPPLPHSPPSSGEKQRDVVDFGQ